MKMTVCIACLTPFDGFYCPNGCDDPDDRAVADDSDPDFEGMMIECLEAEEDEDPDSDPDLFYSEPALELAREHDADPDWPGYTSAEHLRHDDPLPDCPWCPLLDA